MQLQKGTVGDSYERHSIQKRWKAATEGKKKMYRKQICGEFQSGGNTWKGLSDSGVGGGPIDWKDERTGNAMGGKSFERKSTADR